MNTQRLLQDKTFNDVKKLLTNQPYNFKINSEKNLYIINIPPKYRYKIHPQLDHIISECNGLILEKNTNKIVCRGDIIILDAPNIKDILLSNTNIESIYEDISNEEVKSEEVSNVDEVKSEEVSNVDEVKSEEVSNDEVKSEEVKSEEVKSEEVSNEEVKTEEVKTEEVSNDEEVKLEEEVSNDEIKHGGFHSENSYDGVSIRLYFYDNKWNVATKKYITANRSIWNNNKSFGELFLDMNFNTSELDIGYSYHYIMQHPNFRNLVKINEKKMIFKVAFPLQTNSLCLYNNNFNTITSIEETNKYFDTLTNMKYEQVGYIIRYLNKSFFVLCDKFKELKKIRMGGNDLLYKVIIFHKYKSGNEYLIHFPEDTEQINFYNNQIIKTIDIIYQMYMDKFVRKINKNMIINKQIYMVLFHIHKRYLETKEPTIFLTVYEKIMSYSPKRIYNLFKIMM